MCRVELSGPDSSPSPLGRPTGLSADAHGKSAVGEAAEPLPIQRPRSFSPCFYNALERNLSLNAPNQVKDWERSHAPKFSPEESNKKHQMALKIGTIKEKIIHYNSLKLKTVALQKIPLRK